MALTNLTQNLQLSTILLI